MINDNEGRNFKTCDGETILRSIGASFSWLEQHYEEINQLNVFPIPDGDTGTNMLLTLQAAYRAACKDNIESTNGEQSGSVGKVTERLAEGALLGSRGNSGTALSQFLAGFASVLHGVEVINAVHFAKAFNEGFLYLYKVFEKPVEGTMVTVAREISLEIARSISVTDDLRNIIRNAVQRGKQAVRLTPDQLPILKKAGVVDAGGYGLVVILEGILRYAYGLSLTKIKSGLTNKFIISEAILNDVFALAEHNESSNEIGGFGYDVQYMIRGQSLDVDRIRDAIRQMGNSVIVTGTTKLLKVHVHTSDPEIPLKYAQQWGEVIDPAIENMQAQAENYRLKRTELEKTSRISLIPPISDSDSFFSTALTVVIAVVPGDGLKLIFHDLGSAGVIICGQTMNPSVQDFLEAINSLTFKNIILLPNNKNIIGTAKLAAEQAQKLNNKHVGVVATRSIPEGIAALVNWSIEKDLSENLENMHASLGQGVTGEVTIATRNLILDNIQVQTGAFIGLVNGNLAVTGTDLNNVVFDTLVPMINDSIEIVILFYGSKVHETEADTLCSQLMARFPSLEFTMLYGGQPQYLYIIGAE